MKFGIKNNEFINSQVLFAGVLMLISIILVILDEFVFVLGVCISGGILIDAIIRNIQNLLNYIVIDDETITLYRHKKPLKRINLGEIQSFVLGQYMGRVRGRHIQDKYIKEDKLVEVSETVIIFLL